MDFYLNIKPVSKGGILIVSDDMRTTSIVGAFTVIKDITEADIAELCDTARADDLIGALSDNGFITPIENTHIVADRFFKVIETK